MLEMNYRLQALRNTSFAKAKVRECEFIRLPMAKAWKCKFHQIVTAILHGFVAMVSIFRTCLLVAMWPRPTFDNVGSNWLDSFTAGFLTTCGLESVGSPCEDQGEILSLHGSIANQPCAHAYWTENDDAFVIHSVTKDETLFGRKLRITREITISKEENAFTLFDTIQNTGDKEEPLEVLYHMNMGYPLLDEDSQLTIPSIEVTPRDAHAAEDIENWMHMEKPQMGYQERCYYHRFEDAYGVAEIYQPKKNIGLRITFDAEQLDGFVEWKMMGYRDYVLGLECGNCYPDGRNIMRQTGMLKFIQPGEEKQYRVHVKVI